MKISNKLVGLATVAMVAAGFGVVTITARAVTDSAPKVAATSSSKASVSQSSSSVAKKHAQAVSEKKAAVLQAEVKAKAKTKAVAASKATASSVKQAAASSAKPTANAASQSAASSSQVAAARSTTSTQTAQAPAQAKASAQVTTVQTPAQKAAAKAASLRANYGETYVGTISGLGHSTDVVQGSMSRTSAPAQAGLAMTWGGATRLSTTDGMTSEIAGHAKSNTFAWIMGLGVGSAVSVTDASGNSRTYTVYATDDVDDDSYSVKTGKDQYNAITSASQGEAVVLQTCISDTVNRIV